MTSNSIIEKQEKRWKEFYTKQGIIRDNYKMRPYPTLEKGDFNDIIEEFGVSMDETGDKTDYTQIFFTKEGEFDCNRYFKFIFLIRLLDTSQSYDDFLGESNKHMNEETFQRYIDNRRKEEGLIIPKIFLEFWRWWGNIGRSSEPYIDNMDGYNNRFIHDKTVPNYVKVHILSRFIMKRNAAMKGPTNFQTDSKIAEDSRNALRYGEKFLRRAKEETGKNFPEFHSNEYYSAKSVRALFEIERLLFITRTEKDINYIIQSATAVLGSALTIENRIWSAICSYWCNHILWRCFVCKGEIEISDSFKETCRIIIEKYLPNDPFKLELKGEYSDEGHFTTYSDTSKANRHWVIIKDIILMGEKIPHQMSSKKYRILQIERDMGAIKKMEMNASDEKKLEELEEEKNKIRTKNREIKKKKKEKKEKGTELIKENRKKDRNAKGRRDLLKKEIEVLSNEIENSQKDGGENILFDRRREFYVDFMGLDGKKLKIPRRGKGNTTSFFGPSRNTKKAWESKIEYMSEFLNYVLSDLEKSSTIVAIPSAKLAILDVLLLFSRISLDLNPLDVSHKPIDADEEDKIEESWEIAKKSLEKIKSEIERAKIHLEMVTGKEKINELEKIIKKIDEITKGDEQSQSKFIIITKEGSKERSLTNSRKAGEQIQELLQELIEEDEVKLYFPIKS